MDEEERRRKFDNERTRDSSWKELSINDPPQITFHESYQPCWGRYPVGTI